MNSTSVIFPFGRDRHGLVTKIKALNQKCVLFKISFIRQIQNYNTYSCNYNMMHYSLSHDLEIQIYYGGN